MSSFLSDYSSNSNASISEGHVAIPNDPINEKFLMIFTINEKLPLFFFPSIGDDGKTFTSTDFRLSSEARITQ